MNAYDQIRYEHTALTARNRHLIARMSDQDVVDAAARNAADAVSLDRRARVARARADFLAAEVQRRRDEWIAVTAGFHE